MPEQLNIETRLAAIEGKIDALLVAEEKRRKFAMWLLIISVAVVVLPLLAIPLMLPFFNVVAQQLYWHAFAPRRLLTHYATPSTGG